MSEDCLLCRAIAALPASIAEETFVENGRLAPREEPSAADFGWHARTAEALRAAGCSLGGDGRRIAIFSFGPMGAR